MKKFFIAIVSVVALGFVVTAALPHAGFAQIDVFQACGGNSNTAVCKATGNKLFGPNSIWTNILNTLIYATGAISALMIVIGGLRYTISAGDQGGISAAKNTILYAVVGLVLSLMGYAIVNFVLSRI